ncbi:hypothetical protein EUZ85_14260 [Hahella sp. KA22]|uniref:hypothetical protein n=1 Tax=Hahella sp. KA22 TaxID=1628392 RepID=UPI001010A958|nr:hypothetical protein [Hahella sp. KA22]QAY55200.1 hypothetical protein EUZ85_14260 [Hahella sp. KA22]
MIFIWRGVGILVPIIFIFIFWAMPKLAELAPIENKLNQDTIFLTSVIAFCLSTALLGYIANYKLRVVTENEFLKKPIKSPAHAFFFIPIEYWAIIVPIFLYGMPYVRM